MHLVIYLVSAAALLFQVAQTRLFSASLGYHLSYMVISVSLLGVGAGATISTIVDRRSDRPRTSSLALGVAATSVLSLLVMSRIDPNGLGLGLAIPLAYVTGALPFVFASWIVVRRLREDPARSGSLYAADLAGAGAGSIVAFVGTPALGVPALYGAAAMLAALGAAAVRPAAPKPWLALALAAGVTTALTIWPEEIAPSQAGHTKVTLSAPGLVREATAWDPHARVDVLRSDGPRGQPYAFLIDDAYPADERAAALTMVLDLGVVTPIVNGQGDLGVLRASVIAAPYAIVDAPSVLVVGSGGGIDVQTALEHGARRVDAVEVNRAVVGLMRGAFAEYSGDVYLDPRVRVFEDEARSFVRRSSERYDLIALTVVDSYTALASGAYAVSESYLYTAEAFLDDLRHLTDSGVLAVGRWYRDPPIEMLRTAQLAADALRIQGADAPESHLLVLRHRNFGLLLARAQPFDLQATEAVRTFAAAHGFIVAFDPLRPTAPFADSLTGPIPATDDRPFFFAADPSEGEIPVAYVILYLAGVPAVLLSYLVLVRPLRRRFAPALGTGLGILSTLQALAIGLGFIAAEIVLLQRLTLFLGLPAMALAVGLAALLVGAAAGSALSDRLPGSVGLAALASGALVVSGLWLLAWVADLMLPSPLGLRLAAAALATALVGLPLGVMLPRILRRAAAQQTVLVPWIWAVNGAASVVGSILAVGLAMSIGFTALGVLAAACYLLVAVSELSLLVPALASRLNMFPGRVSSPGS